MNFLSHKDFERQSNRYLLANSVVKEYTQFKTVSLVLHKAQI